MADVMREAVAPLLRRRRRPRLTDAACSVRGDRLPAVEIGAVYTIGLELPRSVEAGRRRTAARPLVYGKASSSLIAHGSVITWDRSADGERRRRVRAGRRDRRARRRARLHHRQRHHVARRVARRRPVAARQVDARVLPGRARRSCRPTSSTRPTCTSAARSTARPSRTAEPSWMRFSIGQIIDYLGRHIRLRAGDLIATGTPARLTSPPAQTDTSSRAT